MKKKEIKEWENSIRRVLDTIWKFRKLCQKPFDRGFIGELLVLEQLLKTYGSKLCASTDNNFVYAGSAAKKWDISLTLNNKKILINAKAASMKDKDNKPRWVRQQAKLFCDVEIDPKTLRQTVFSKEDSDPNLFYVFVDIGTWLKNRKAKAIFYTLSDKKAQSIFKEKYSRGQNNEIRKSGSTDFWIEYTDIKKSKDDNISRIFKKD